MMIKHWDGEHLGFYKGVVIIENEDEYAKVSESVKIAGIKQISDTDYGFITIEGFVVYNKGKFESAKFRDLYPVVVFNIETDIGKDILKLHKLETL